MLKLLLHLMFFVIFFTGCSYTPPPPVKMEETSIKKIDYLSDVKPILDKRCVVCHSCYNAPCQLKLSSYDGLQRGATKAAVYNAERLSAAKQTRLFIDGHSEEDWRKKDFFSVVKNNAEQGFNDSIMMHLLQEKVDNPEIIGEFDPETEDLICSRNQEEVGKYLEKKEHRGMPYGFPNMSKEEFKTLKSWLAQGAKGPTDAQIKAYKSASIEANVSIKKWEKFLNQDDAKHAMTSRYLYEHLYLAHINFGNSDDEFFELVRSKTPSPEAIDLIPSIRPYDNPEVKKFYYRFQKIYSTIVHKTHMVVVADDAYLKNVQELFIDTPWMETPHIEGYAKKRSANPFLTYAQIPPKVRYQYLLDNAHYIIMTFIRGPVCRGQIALAAIHDDFWIMFQDPKYDIGVQRPSILLEQANNLRLPTEMGSDATVFKAFSDKYLDKYLRYYKTKQRLLDELYPNGLGIEAIYKGRKASDAPIMTVYRHFDSASVHKGAIGSMPRTAWVIDYSHLERIYYNLVAGFDVYGNLAHQVHVRRYMDFLRFEGELNFISFMPKKKQLDMFKRWNKNDSWIEGHTVKDMWKRPSAVKFKTDTPAQEFMEELVNNHFLKETNIKFDNINYYTMGERRPTLPKVYKTNEDIRNGFRSLTAPGTGFIRKVVDYGVNLIYIRLDMNNGAHIMGTMVINRWHDNVNSLLLADGTLDSEKDTIDFHLGAIGSYPNVFFIVKEDDVGEFFNMLMHFQENDAYRASFKKFATSRANKDFWKYYDWFQEYFNTTKPLTSGMFDLNRYYHTPW